jgi:hypothetical protein
MPAKANSGGSSLSANHTTSFFFVSGFGSGAYSAKLKLTRIRSLRRYRQELVSDLVGPSVDYFSGNRFLGHHRALNETSYATA